MLQAESNYSLSSKGLVLVSKGDMKIYFNKRLLNICKGLQNWNGIGIKGIEEEFIVTI